MERIRKLLSPESLGIGIPSSTYPGRFAGATLCFGLVLLLVLASTGRIDSVAKNLLVRFNRFAPVAPLPEPDTLSEPPPPIFTLRDLPMHPEVRYRSYLSRSVFTSSSTDDAPLRQFHDLLDLFEKRLGVDDNFTVRVVDNRTHELLELYVLEEERARYQRGADVDWREIDRERRQATRRLVDKYVRRGIPRGAVTIKWGRANQVQEAHQRDLPYVEYEIKLARYLDLSLLPTEIGTVETFNQDWLVSSVGARSRYQMMPYVLRRSGINQYNLRVESGNWVKVREEWHPLLTMEPAFQLLRGYVNAVGHEIPGISAYHTGPGNIYKLYRLFFTESKHFDASSSVMDAYVWGVTEGFEKLREQSTFGPYSRGYIASAYGALRAIDTEEINPSKTLRTARVQLKPGANLTLERLLAALDSTDQALDWGLGTQHLSTYERFRTLNPHFDLPATQGGELPPSGNVRFVASVDGKAVRFFLPIGASEILQNAGLDVLDEGATFRFDETTYSPPSPAQVTVWDRQYDALVNDIQRFGFTPANRKRLLQLHDRFVALAEQNPTHFRQTQLDIIRTHRRIWLSNPWEELSDAAMLATGRVRVPVQPPVALHTDTLDEVAIQPEP